MPSTYTVNLGIEKPATGEQSGTWGDTTNTNFDILDQAINGAVRVTLTSAGTSGSPNQLQITNGAASDGRNKWIEIYSASDLGGSAYLQLDPNDAEKILFIRNSLAGSQSILLFQGTYNSGRDLEVPAGVDMVVKFDGGGASAATVTDVYTKLRVTELTTPTLTATTADINGGTLDNSVIGGTTAAAITGTTIVANTSLNIAGDGATVTGIKDEDDMSSNSATKLATQQSIKAYVDSQVGTVDTWAEVLANGATSGSTNPEVTAGQALKTNTINETSAGSGVTIDSVLLKDDVVNATDIEVSSISANDGTEAATLANSTGVMTIASSVLTTTDINGGSIDGTNIGANSRGTGSFTTGDFSGLVQFNGTAGLQLDDGAQVHSWSLDDNFTSRFNIGTSSASAAWIFGSNNQNYWTVSPSGVVINQDSNDVDFRVESNNNANMLFVDAGNDSVNIAGASDLSAGNLIVTGSANATSAAHRPAILGRGSYGGGIASLDTLESGWYQITSGTVWNFYHGRNTSSDTPDSKIVQTFNSGETVFNESSRDLDFRVESNGNANMLFVDAGNDRVGVGTNAPASHLHLTSGADTVYTIGTTNATADARIQFRNSSGTDAGGLWYATNNNRMLFRTNSIEHMVLGNKGDLTITSTDAAAAAGPLLDLHRNSASPADNDYIGEIRFQGENDASEVINYAGLAARIIDVTDGTEDGRFELYTSLNGAQISRVLADSSTTIINQDSADLDFRVESDASTHALFVDAGSEAVGVFTSSPNAPLHVQTSHTSSDVTAANSNATLNVANSGSGNGVYNAIKFAANQQDMYIMSFNNNTQANRRLGFFVGSVAGDAATDERLSITGNGRIGVNQLSPDYTVHVGDGGQGNRVHIEGNGGGALFSGVDSVNNDTNGFRWGHLNGTDRLEGAIGTTEIIDWRKTVFYFNPNGTESFAIGTDFVTVNNGSLDLDFRVESNNQTHMLFVDGGEDAVGMGRTPGAGLKLDIQGSSTSTLSALRIRNAGQVAASAVKAIWSLNRDGSDIDFEAASIVAFKEQNWTTTASTVDSGLSFNLIQNETNVERLRLLSGGTAVFSGDITYTSNGPSVRGQIILADSGGSEGATGGVEYHTSSGGGGGYGVRTIAGGGTDPELYTQTRTNSSSWTRITKVSGSQFAVSNDTLTATSHLGFGLGTNGGGSSRFTITNNEAFIYDNFNGSGYYQIDFRWNNTEIGRIQTNSSSTAYETGSDYRLKENITDITDGIDLVKQLQPKRYNFIANADTDVETGFIAHEVEEVLDHVVSGEKDATLRVGDITDADGNLVKQSVREPTSLEEGQTWTYVQTVDQYQMLDYARLTPILTAALKEAVAKIEALEARVASLESP